MATPAALFGDIGKLYQSRFPDDDNWAWANGGKPEVTEDALPFVFPRFYWMLMYRKDWFKQYNIPMPPNTWEELVTAVSQLQYSLDFSDSTAPSGGGDASERRHAICLDLAPNCKGFYLLMSIAASILQHQGTAQGIWFDPLSMQPLVNTTGFSYALNIYRQLLQLAGPHALQGCSRVNKQFVQGRCGLTIDLDAVMLYYTYNPNTMSTSSKEAMQKLEPTGLKGYLGFSQLPGSSRVLDRDTGQLVVCDKSLCPYATQHPVISRSDRGGNSGAPQGSDGDAGDSDAGMAWINRAPYSLYAVASNSIDANSPKDHILRLHRFWDLLMTPWRTVAERTGQVLEKAYQTKLNSADKGGCWCLDVSCICGG